MKLTTQQHIEDLIRANYPEQSNYWLYGNKRKHTEITLSLKCGACGHEETATIKSREEIKGLLRRECVACLEKDRAANAHLDRIRILFGKHRGKSISEVMEDDPSYLAWVVDCCTEREWLIEQIKTHTRFSEAWDEYQERKKFKVGAEKGDSAPSCIPFPSTKPSIPRPPMPADELSAVEIRLKQAMMERRFRRATSPLDGQSRGKPRGQ